MSRAAIAVVLLSLVVGVLPATARRIRPMPLRLRIEGYVGAPPTGVVALARWVVDVQGAQYTLTVTTLEPGASAKIAYWDIINALEPLPVAMTLFGKTATLAAFTHAAPGQQIAIDGAFELRRGPSSLLVNRVEPLGTPAPGATPPASAPNMHTAAPAATPSGP